MTHQQQQQHEVSVTGPAHLATLDSVTPGCAPSLRSARGWWRTLLVATLLLVIGGSAPGNHAWAHAELRQASPDRGETVGGAIHSITLQFFDLDVTKPQTAAVFDSAGNELPGQVNRDGQRLVIALVDPIMTPGDYLVTFAANGIDGDYTEESYTFRWEEGAPEPSGIALTEPVGLDTFNYVLLLVGAALTAFLVHRVMGAWREVRAERAQAAAETPVP